MTHEIMNHFSLLMNSKNISNSELLYWEFVLECSWVWWVYIYIYIYFFFYNFTRCYIIF